jgi:HAD superfamily hydrolase (TIGR01509 family)
MVDAVVFDLDGVLVDSEPVWERIRRGYVAAHSGRWQPDSQQRLMGMSTYEWARYLSEELGVDRPPDQVATDVVNEMIVAHLPLIPSADAVVRRLGERWPLGLASSSPRRLIKAALAAAGLGAAFTVTLSTEEVPRGKPAPDVYLAVAASLGVAPARCVAVEDSSNGVRSAAAAGMRVIAVPRRRYPLDADARTLAARVVTEITEVTPDLVTTLG